MERVLNFLSDLGANNDKIWFEANKNRYKEAKSIFEDFADELIERVKYFDSSMNGLTLIQQTTCYHIAILQSF